MHSRVADCIMVLLSRKAKLKGENPPPAKPYISTPSNKSHWMGGQEISFFVCRPTTYHFIYYCLWFPDFFFCLPLWLFLGLNLSFSHSLTLFSAYWDSSLTYLPVLVFKSSACCLNASPICRVCAAAGEDITPTLSYSNHLTIILLHVSSLPSQL